MQVQQMGWAESSLAVFREEVVNDFDDSVELSYANASASAYGAALSIARSAA